MECKRDFMSHCSIRGGSCLNASCCGQRSIVVGIIGEDKTAKQLERLGLVPGQTVTTVNRCGGDVIVEVKGCRLALDGSLAAKVMCRPVMG